MENKSTKPELEVLSWELVGLWSLEVQIETCAICRNHILDRCIECNNSGSKDDQEGCVVSWGKCGHAFHKHCISKWLSSRNVCPLDTQQWVYDELPKDI